MDRRCFSRQCLVSTIRNGGGPFGAGSRGRTCARHPRRRARYRPWSAWRRRRAPTAARDARLRLRAAQLVGALPMLEAGDNKAAVFPAGRREGFFAWAQRWLFPLSFHHDATATQFAPTSHARHRRFYSLGHCLEEPPHSATRPCTTTSLLGIARSTVFLASASHKFWRSGAHWPASPDRNGPKWRPFPAQTWCCIAGWPLLIL